MLIQQTTEAITTFETHRMLKCFDMRPASPLAIRGNEGKRNVDADYQGGDEQQALHCRDRYADHAPKKPNESRDPEWCKYNEGESNIDGPNRASNKTPGGAGNIGGWLQGETINRRTLMPTQIEE